MNSQEYFDWLSKFETKKTTDDCYTPPAVYDVVVDYVHNHVINLDGLKIVRPFYPDGDYTDLSQYDENTIVIDNPPFSIMTKICKFYQENSIKFFLFAPALAVLQSMRLTHGLTAIIAPYSIVYANGAKVPTSFITNTTPKLRVKTAPMLFNSLSDLDNNASNKLPKYTYPSNVLMVSRLQKLCRAGVDFELPTTSSIFIQGLDSQKKLNKQCFGGGLLINDTKAKELEAKENSVVWDLLDKEKQIIERLNHA